MIDIAQVQGQVHAQSVQKVGEIADKNPRETVSIIRQWLQRERRRLSDQTHGRNSRNDAANNDDAAQREIASALASLAGKATQRRRPSAG